MDVSCANKTAKDFSSAKFRSRNCHYNHQRHRYTILALVAFNLFHLALATPVFVNNPSLTQFQSGRNIRHLPCIVRKSGLSGVCMFAIDCIKSNGTHIGTCIDRFYFGSCCQMKDDNLYLAHEINDNSIDQNTISHFPHEVTTVPTSALFKLTTQSHSTSNIYTPQILSSTERLTNNSLVPVPPQKTESVTTNIGTGQPSISALLDETATSLPSVKPDVVTMIQSIRTTTPSLPILTTTKKLANSSSTVTTTESSRFTTFQVVSSDGNPTDRPTEKSTSMHTITRSSTRTPTTQKLTKPTKRITSSSKSPSPGSSSNVTTRRPSSKITTIKQRPSTTRRPTTKRPPSGTKKPITSPQTKPRPSRRPTTPIPLQSTSNKKSSISLLTTQRIRTTTPVTPPRSTTNKNFSVSTPTTSTITKAPRPRPTPTSQIVKVSPSIVLDDIEEKEDFTTLRPVDKVPQSTIVTASQQSTTKQPSTTTKEYPTTKEKIRIPTKPSTTTATPSSTTPSKSSSSSSSSTSSSSSSTSLSINVTSTTLHNTDTTKPTLPMSSLNAPAHEATTLSPKPITTESIITTPEIILTTLKPGLVTWTNLDEAKRNSTTQSNHVVEEEWKPRPPPSDWVPLPTIKPDGEVNKTSSTMSIASSTVQDPSTTESWIQRPSSEQTVDDGTKSTAEPNLTSSSIPWMDITPQSTSTETFSSSSSTSVTEDTVDENTTLISSTQIPSLEGIDYRLICGKRMFPEPRIVGGANAAFGRWPWQISLRQWRTSTYLHKCGAALLNENWAITAAHCVDNVPPSDLLLRLGEYDLAEEEEPYGYQERRVQIVASHPQFDPRTFEYDLALLRFYEPVVFQPNIIPVCVPDTDADFIGQTAYVTGWGRLYEDGPLPSVLQEVSVPVINNTICETMYRTAGYIEHIPHIFICAGWKKGGYDSCEGDSGGPMVLQREDKRFLLAGIISWGIGCAEPNQPGVYTRISEFRDWINQILQF